MLKRNGRAGKGWALHTHTHTHHLPFRYHKTLNIGLPPPTAEGGKKGGDKKGGKGKKKKS